MSFFKIDAQASANGGAVEGVHYVLIKDGHGVPHKYINFDNPDICPREGIIELVPTVKTSRHENYLNCTTFRDPETDIIIAIPTGIDSETKKITHRKIVLRDEEIFRLNKREDAMIWTVVKHNPLVEGSPFRNTTGLKQKYRVYDKEREAQEFMNKVTVKRKAESIAQGLSGSQLRDVAISIGLMVDNMSPVVMAMEVIKYAEKSPKQFMDIWDNPNRHELTLIKKGISMGVLTVDGISGIMYNGLPIGMSEPQAIEYLKNQPGLSITLENTIALKEADTVKAMDNGKPKISDEKDVENAKLQARIEALEKELRRVSDVKVDEVVKASNEDEEMLALKKEAKELKVPGWQLIKNKDLLRQKINETAAKQPA